MPRKAKSSPLEDLTTWVSMLPWWAGLGLALVLFLAFHALARISMAPMTAAGRMPDIEKIATTTLIRTGASILQYVIPLFCVIGAVISAWKRYARRQLFRSVTANDSAAAISDLEWHDFERFIGEAYRRRGYTVSETGGMADGGIDLVLVKAGERFLVQCKHWRAFKVGVDVVRELYGVMAARGAAGGFVVTSGRFTSEAIKFAVGRNVELVDGSQLGNWLALVDTRKASQPVSPAYARTSPLCPICSSVMVDRVGRKGLNAGAHFWGCSRFPSCRGTRRSVADG